jgi:hypothetical protein
LDVQVNDEMEEVIEKEKGTTIQVLSVSYFLFHDPVITIKHKNIGT